MEKKEKGLETLTKTQKFFLCLGVGIMGMVVFTFLNSSTFREKRRKRERLRHYKPTYRGGFWGTYTDWTERETPLTDDELTEKLKLKGIV